MISVAETKLSEIQKGNDLLRKTLHSYLGKVVLSRSVALHPDKERILDAVRAFNDFHEGNDPNGEHEFALFQVEVIGGMEKFCFKIDYYDEAYEWGADPYCDPFKRMITIMLASDY